MKRWLGATLAVWFLGGFLRAGTGLEEGRLTLFGETCLAASGGGASFCTKLKGSSILELSASMLRSSGFEAETALAFHVSQLYKMGKAGRGGLYLGYGASYVSIPGLEAGVPAAHFRVKVDIPLGEQSGIHIGSYPLLVTVFSPFFAPVPNLQVGLYVRL